MIEIILVVTQFFVRQNVELFHSSELFTEIQSDNSIHVCDCEASFIADMK